MKRIKMNQVSIAVIPIVASGLFMFSCQQDEEMTKLENKIAEYEEVIIEEVKYLSDIHDVFTVVEEQPIPEGGMGKYYEYIASNLQYPVSAKAQGIEGRVFVQFIVDENGELTDVQAVKGIGAGCDQEAVRVVKESKAWIAGRQKGVDVKVRMILPISFKLNPKPESSALLIE